MIEIRPYQPEDVDALTELMAELGYPSTVDKMRQRMEKMESIPLYYTFVAVIHSQVVGMVGVRELFYYEDDGTVTQISALVTRHDYQGQGIGRALVHYVEEWAAQRESNGLVLTSGIKPERARAHEFYKALGFDVTGYRFVKQIST